MSSLAAASPAIRIELADPRSEPDISAAIALGNSSRRTLGLLPARAYHDAALNGTLVLARQGPQVVAYALYALARGRVRLTHLCVASDHRGKGIARTLVDWISSRHSDYRGILARSRHDYGLGQMWIRLGFTQLWEAPGRGKAGLPVVNWWRDHGHPNIFTRSVESVLVRAAIDFNVLRDLAAPTRPGARESLALLSDAVSDRLQLVRTSALDAELDTLDSDLRAVCTRRADGIASVRGLTRRSDEVRTDLLAAVRQRRPDFPHNDQDQFDVRHVADAIAAAVDLLVTRDERLIEIFGPVAEERYGFQVLQPAEVIVRIDELVRTQAYKPAALLATPFRRQLLRAGQDRDVIGLTTKRAHESPRELQGRIRGLATTGVDRVGVFGPDGKLESVFATSRVGARLDVVTEHVVDKREPRGTV